MPNWQNVRFIRSVADAGDLPRDGRPQIAFAGRSNVGKSSVINCLLARKSLARTSSEPGKTIHANLFDIDGAAYFVDLPGYGYARVSDAEKRRWARLLESYFTDNAALALCVLLVDVRHRPTDGDLTMRDFLRHYGVPFLVAANKCDKLGAAALAPALETVRETLELADGEPLIPFSARERTGRRELLEKIGAALDGGKN